MTDLFIVPYWSSLVFFQKLSNSVTTNSTVPWSYVPYNREIAITVNANVLNEFVITLIVMNEFGFLKT